MVSSTLCPAVHILGSQNVYGRAEGIADHYWPWAVFYHLLLSYLFNGEILLQNKELYGPVVFHLTFVNRYL